MDDLKEKIYLLALDMIKSRKVNFICDALVKSYREYTVDEEELSHEELQEFFSEFFSLYDHKYWYELRDKSIGFRNQYRIHGCWWSSELPEPRKRILELILSRGCR